MLLLCGFGILLSEHFYEVRGQRVDAAIRPATTFVEVKGFINREWLVEVEVDCVADQ
jgi:enamine deaminase RidA (YjgF/YER057c/UK114 family)